MVYLIVRFSEVVQSQNVIQEVTELRGKVFKHKPMVIRLFEISYLLLRREGKFRIFCQTHIL